MLTNSETVSNIPMNIPEDSMDSIITTPTEDVSTSITLVGTSFSTPEESIAEILEAEICQSSPYFQAVSDLIESIALEQTALSHILNAEGEKLQKVISMNPTPDDLISANESVRSMVNTIVRLEIILHAKLETVDCDICDNCINPLSPFDN